MSDTAPAAAVPSHQIVDGWWHLYDFTPRYRYVGRRSHIVVCGPWGEKSLCGRIWNLDRRSGDGYRRCAECVRRQETLPAVADPSHKSGETA